MRASVDLPALVLTRPAAQQEAWRSGLEALGVRVRVWPLIDIGPAPDASAPFDAWRRLPKARLAFFASPNAVEAVMQARPSGVAWPLTCWASCVGPGSAAALLNAGVPPERVLTPPLDAAQFDSESLWAVLSQVTDWRGENVLMLQGQGGREWLADRLKEEGASVHALAVYQRRCPSPDASALARLKAWMQESPSLLWLLSSSEAVRHWQTLAGGPLPPLPTLATHPRIAQAARAAGLLVTEVMPSMPAVAQAWRHHAEHVQSVQRPAP